MRLPAETATSSARLGYARYVARRLRRAKLNEFEIEVKTASDALKVSAATEVEAEEAVQDALADRDAYDDDLDDTAKRHRQAIEGRGTNANRERPYTDIYPDGIAWYTSAPLDQQKVRYELLVRRYADHLSEGDPLRAEGGAITEALGGWATAVAALEKAQLEVSVARAKTSRVTDDWESTLTRLYYRLAERMGKANAERFFPRTRRGAAPDPGGDGGGGGPPS